MEYSRLQNILGKASLSALIIVLFFVISGTTAFAADGWEWESNDSRAAADSISCTGTYNGQISSSSDSDYFRFTTTQRGTVTVKFTHNYVADETDFWNVELQTVDGDIITEDYISGDKTSVTLTKIGLPAGTYYIHVKGDWYWSSATYSVSAGWKASSVWETEFNNSRPTADKIVTNKKYYGNIESSSDGDYYKFTISKSGPVTVKFTHNYVADETDFWNVELQTVDGDIITEDYISGDKTSVALTKIGLPAGTYYIHVKGDWYWSSATYSVCAEWKVSSVWETEFNNSRPTADKIVTNKKYYGNIESSSDGDYYKFTISKSCPVTVKFTHNYVADETDFWNVELQTVDGDIITEDYIAGDKTSVTLPKMGLSAGTYYIHVKGDWYWSDKLYTVTAMVPATAAPAKLIVKRYGYDDIKCSWSAVSGASGYRVYCKRSTSDVWTSLGATKKTYIKKSDLVDGAKYYFKVVPYKKQSDGTYNGLSKTSIGVYTLKQMNKPKAVKNGYKVKVSWSKVNGADGYHVEQYKMKNGKYIKVAGYYTTSNVKSFTAKKGRTYYYRVRAYDKAGDEKIFAPWSKKRIYTR